MSETRTSQADEAAENRIALGQELRRARETRNVTLAQLASETRIALRHLEALEADRLEDLPGQLYARNFVRTVARTLGADEEGLLEVFDYQAGRTGAGSSSEAVATAGGARRVAFAALGAAVLITAAVLALAGWKAFGTGSAEEAEAAQPRPVESLAAAAVEPAPAETSQASAREEPPARESAKPEPAAAREASPARPEPKSDPTPAATEVVSPPKPKPEPVAAKPEPVTADPEPAVEKPEPEAPAREERPEVREPVNSAAPPPPAPPPAAVEPAAVEEPAAPQARLVFSGPSWIEIVPQGRGEQIMGLKTAGQTVSFPLDSTVEVTVANAGNVELWIDGRPARALGAHGERRTMKLDARNWQSFLR